MPSIFKTFVPGEVILASDVNGALNPSTADHIPRAVATQRGLTIAAIASGATKTQIITWPPGRFTAAPAVFATPTNAFNGRLYVESSSPTSCTVTAINAATGIGTVTLDLIAVQM